MNIDVFSSDGKKSGTKSLPESLFGAPVNRGLIHQAVMLQQSNRRNAIAHAKNRHEVAGSTRKLYGQKHTGNARRGSIRSPLLRGGGKAFGPRSNQNFQKEMPHGMRHAALASCLSLQAERKVIVGLEGYAGGIKTKAFSTLLGKLPVELGRKILIVMPEKQNDLSLSARNVPNVKTLLVNYLNPEDVLAAKMIVFVGDSVEKAVEIFTAKKKRVSKVVTKTTSAAAETSDEKGEKGEKVQKGKKVTKAAKPSAKKAKATSKKAAK